MTLLLCPECCQWREPVEGRCPVCAGSLDLAIPDSSSETIAEVIGDLQGLLGEADVSRGDMPERGRLWGTTNGLLFVPCESRVIVFTNDDRTGSAIRPGRLGRWIDRWWSRLSGREPTARFACERRANEFAVSDRLALAELLRSDPGILFWSRGTIATWRRQRGQWELIRPNASSWPERIAMRDRDGNRALQIWLETTACPLPVNAR